jgi:membrane protease YdiL (CAAX protease family)
MVRKQNGLVSSVIIGFAIILAFLAVVNPLARTPCYINLVFLVISFLIYRAKEYQDDLVGIKTKGFVLSSFFGLIAGLLFFGISKLVPGFSLGFPIMPQSIADSLKFFFIVFVAPIAETIFFQGAIYAYIKNFNTSKSQRWVAIFIQAILFSLFHLGAYVAGFYQYEFSQGIGIIGDNISAFIVAFFFALVAGWYVTKDGVKNLAFVATFHFMINLLTYLPMAITFAT